MMKEKKLSQMILKLHDRAEAAKYDGDSSPPYQEVEMLNFHDEESVVHVTFQTTVNNENKTSEEAEMEDVIAKDA